MAVDSWAYLNPYHMLGLAEQAPKSHGSADPVSHGGLPPSTAGSSLSSGSTHPLHPNSALFWLAGALALVGLGFVGIHGGAHAGPAHVTAGVGR